MKFLLTACILTTLSVAMSWQLDYHLTLANPQDDLSKDCDDLVLDMMDCLSFLSGDEKTTKPSPDCCKGLKTVLDTNEKCVCYALQYAPTIGIAINMSRAAVMPSLCHLDAPPISSCNISVSPAPSPATPAPSPATPPLTPAPEPVIPNPPTQPPSTPAVPPSSPATPPSSPVSPAPPTPSPPSNEPPASSPQSASGVMHIQMPFPVSLAVIVVSLVFV